MRCSASMIGEKKTFAADPLYYPGSTRLDPITGVTTGALITLPQPQEPVQQSLTSFSLFAKKFCGYNLLILERFKRSGLSIFAACLEGKNFMCGYCLR